MVRNPFFASVLAVGCSFAVLGCGNSGGQQEQAGKSKSEQADKTETPADHPLKPDHAAAHSHRDSKQSSSKEQTVAVSLVTPDQLQAAIQKHKGQVVLVDFWATWCVPCIQNFPHTVEWHKEYGDKGLAVISVSMDDPDEQTQKSVVEFLKKQNAVFTNFQSQLGGDQEGMQGFQIPGGAVPYYKIYDKTGKLAKTFGDDPCNPFGPKDIETAIQKALGL